MRNSKQLSVVRLTRLNLFACILQALCCDVYAHWRARVRLRRPQCDAKSEAVWCEPIESSPQSLPIMAPSVCLMALLVPLCARVRWCPPGQSGPPLRLSSASRPRLGPIRRAASASMPAGAPLTPKCYHVSASYASGLTDAARQLKCSTRFEHAGMHCPGPRYSLTEWPF